MNEVFSFLTLIFIKRTKNKTYNTVTYKRPSTDCLNYSKQNE